MSPRATWWPQVISTKVQVAKSNQGVVAVVRDVLDADGVLGFFRGFRASLLLCINPAINYTVFEQLKRRLLASTGARSLTTFQAFVLGAIGKIVATLCTYPWVRAKVMMQSGTADKKVCYAYAPSVFGRVAWRFIGMQTRRRCRANRARQACCPGSTHSAVCN